MGGVGAGGPGRREGGGDGVNFLGGGGPESSVGATMGCLKT